MAASYLPLLAKTEGVESTNNDLESGADALTRSLCSAYVLAAGTVSLVGRDE